jgi:hypothetical protein
VVKSLTTNKGVNFLPNENGLPCLDDEEPKPVGKVMRPDMVTDRDNCGLLGRDSELLPGVLAWYREKWIKGRVFYCKTYVVYLEDSKKGFYAESADSSDGI